MSGTPPLCRSTGAALRCRYRCAMCGRYASTRSAADLATLFDALDDTDGDLVADYNVAPTDPAPIVRLSARAGGRVVAVARWGLVPAWSRDRTGGGPDDQRAGRDGGDVTGVRAVVAAASMSGAGRWLVRVGPPARR